MIRAVRKRHVLRNGFGNARPNKLLRIDTQMQACPNQATMNAKSTSGSNISHMVQANRDLADW
jgi:hypothetical protein